MKTTFFILIVIALWILSLPFAIWHILNCGGETTADDFMEWVGKLRKDED